LSDKHFIADPVNLSRRRGYAPAGKYEAMEFFYYFPILDGDGPDFDDPMAMGWRKACGLDIQGDYSRWQCIVPHQSAKRGVDITLQNAKARTRCNCSSFGLYGFYPVGKVPSRIMDGKGLVGWIRVTQLSEKK
jgi:hypothetical protein